MKRVSVLANDDRREELKACGLNFAELGLKEMSFDQHIQSGNLNSETDLVIVAGGDGSLNYAINQLHKKNLTEKFSIYLIPMGTANDFSRFLDLSKEKALEKLKELKFSNSLQLYYGELKDRVFVNMASCGGFGNITPDVPSDMKGLMGCFSYYLKALELLTDRKTYSLQVNIDGEDFEFNDVIGFFIGNSKYAGGGVKLTGEASPEQDCLDFLLVKEAPLLDLLDIALEMQLDSSLKEDSKVFYRKFKNLSISGNEQIPMALDGEQINEQNFSVKLCSSSWRMIY